MCMLMRSYTYIVTIHNQHSPYTRNQTKNIHRLSTHGQEYVHVHIPDLPDTWERIKHIDHECFAIATMN